MKKFFAKILAALKKVPWYGWVFGIVMIGFDLLFYNGTSAIIRACPSLTERAIVPKIDAIDNAIPLVPYFFVQVYLLSFPFWFCGPVIASVTKKQNFLNYMIGLFVAYVIGAIIFLSIPTVMNRGSTAIGIIPPENITQRVKEGSGFSWALMKLMLGSDGGDMNYNLFPSFHCMISLWVFLGAFKQKEVPLGVQIGNGVYAILIFMSTLFTKQHYFVDMPIGMLLTVFTYWLVGLIKPGERIVKKWPNIFVIKLKKKTNLSKNSPAEDTKIESK